VTDGEGETEALWWASGYRHKGRQVPVKKHERTTARKTVRQRGREVCLWWAEIVQGVDPYPSRFHLFTSSSKHPLSSSLVPRKADLSTLTHRKKRPHGASGAVAELGVWCALCLLYLILVFFFLFLCLRCTEISPFTPSEEIDNSKKCRLIFYNVRSVNPLVFDFKLPYSLYFYNGKVMGLISKGCMKMIKIYIH